MRFLVDGYNVTLSDPATKDLTLEEQREALVARLAARRRDLLGDGEVTVVSRCRRRWRRHQAGSGGDPLRAQP